MKPQRFYGPRKRTLKDRRAEGVLFLTRARSLDDVAAAWFAERFAYPLATAERMLSEARGRRHG